MIEEIKELHEYNYFDEYYSAQEQEYYFELYDRVANDGYSYRIPGTLEEELCHKNQKP